MVRLFGNNLTRRQLEKYVADLSQVAGVRPFTFSEGPARGMAGVDVRSGGGLNYTILPDRGLDLSVAECLGTPFAWRSCVGDRSPSYFEPEQLRWLRTFGGGLLVTCGLDSVGPPSEEDGQSFGLHGRYSSLPAEQVSSRQQWKGNQCTLVTEGTVRQASVFGEYLVLQRRIETPLGENIIRLHDRVENKAASPSPHMILYHWNFGYPLLDESARLYAPAEAVVPRDEDAAPGLERAMMFEKPTRCSEQVYFHSMKARRGWVEVALINPKLNGGRGFGILLRYKADTLPCFTQWKMMGDGTYVLGLEPGNSRPEGRVEARRQGALQTLRPGQSVEYVMELRVLSDPEEIKKVSQQLS
jgi:hypothetical protein